MNQYKPTRENPSFSSTLLDTIYRSIESEDEEDISSRQKKISSNNSTSRKTNGREILKRETWMEKKEVRTTATTHEKVFMRRKPMEAVDYGNKRILPKESSLTFLNNSSSSSSDSSFSGGFSSSEAESFQHGLNPKSSNYSMHWPKPIRTSISFSRQKRYQESRDYEHENRAKVNEFKMVSGPVSNYQKTRNRIQVENKTKHETDNFVKTKSRALKIYGDLKKVKQPISPGGRLASFINSLFATGNNGKKEKKVGYDDEFGPERKSKSTHGSTCSSASSFSRSCLSKTPSSTKEVKRSVRFCPVNIILDAQDCQPCGETSLYESDSLKTTANPTNKKEFKFLVRDESFMIKNDIRELLKKYQKGGDYMSGVSDNYGEDNQDEDDDDDAASYASSDLFELDNLASIGIERYKEELPVYETTYLDTNRAIANRLMA